MERWVILTSRAVDPIERIIVNVINLFRTIFTTSSNGYATMIVNTIINSPYLLVAVSLMVCGFVIGLINRLIRM